MIDILRARVQQGHRTLRYPDAMPTLSDRFRGRPVLCADRCRGTDCGACTAVCPTGAFVVDVAGPALDMGRCIFCGACAAACPEGVVTFTADHRLAARRREDLVVRGDVPLRATPLESTRLELYELSFKLRQVSAAGCNACEADCNVLGTLAFDLGQYGVQFVASPRHADAVLVTGPVSRAMELALRKTWDAVPSPRVVIAVGACAISGGIYAGSPQVLDGCTGLLDVDLFVPGCPPNPWTILDGLLRLLGRVTERGAP